MNLLNGSSVVVTLLPRAFVSGSIWAFIGKICTIFLGVVVYALLARLLSPDELGVYFLAFSIVSFLAVTAQLGFNQLVVKLIASEEAAGCHTRAAGFAYFSIRIAAVAGIVFGLFYGFVVGPWLGYSYFSSVTLEQSSVLVGMWCVAFVAQGILAECYRGYKNIALSTLYTGLMVQVLLLIALLVIPLLGFDADLRLVILITAIVTSMSALFAYLGLHARLTLREQILYSEKRQLFSQSMPLLVFGVLVSLMDQLELWVAGSVLGEEEVALYGAALRLVRLVAFGLVVINVVIPPFLAEFHANGEKKELERMLRLTATVAAIPALLLLMVYVLFGKQILLFVFGDYYAVGSTILVILSVGQVVNVLTGAGASLLAMTGNQMILMKITAVMVVLKFLAVVFLVPAFGIEGAALGAALILAAYNIWIALECKSKIGVLPIATFGTLSFCKSKR